MSQAAARVRRTAVEIRRWPCPHLANVCGWPEAMERMSARRRGGGGLRASPWRIGQHSEYWVL